MKTDLLIAGGGLAGGLVALALAERRPDLAVTLVEGAATLGGNHIWSFFDSDIAAEDRWLVDPLVGHRWASGYDVAFPGHARTLDGVYNSIESEAFDAALRARLPADRLVLDAPIATLDAAGATLADGRRIGARAVIDARGAGPAPMLSLGWQKFVGQSLRLERPHGLTRPTVMDATVAQIDGYRFVYLLPFGPDEIFVEDTYYSEDPAIDRAAIAARIADYVGARGWRIAAILREEAGALPIALAGDIEALLRTGTSGVAPIGMAAASFHPMTGYSLPDAVRTAAMIAAWRGPIGRELVEALDRRAIEAWRARGFYRLLARLLFRAAEGPKRYRMLERFYTLRPALIERLYSGRSTMLDKMRILAGKPPVPFFRAARIVFAGETE